MHQKVQLTKNNQLIKVAPLCGYSDRNISIRLLARHMMFSGGGLSLEFRSVRWKEEEIIQEKGEKSIKVAPLYGSEQ